MIRNLRHKYRFKRGLTLVEVVIASAIILVAVLTLIGVHTLYLKVALSNGNVVKGVYLAEEGIEVARHLRNLSWANNIEVLATGINYGVVFSNGNWQTSTTDKWVDGFERTITFSNVFRGANGDIVSSGGTLDTDTRLVVSNISWTDNGATTTKSVSTYLTNIFDN